MKPDCRIISAWLICMIGGLYAVHADEGVPRLVCDAPNHNFGDAFSDTEMEHTFILRNEGDEPLVIHRVHSSCGCTVANLSGTQIDPDGEQELTSKISLRGRHGLQRMHINVHSNDPENPVLRLNIEGRAIRDLEIRPRLVSFGTVTPDSVSARTLDLFSEKEAFHLKDIASNMNGLGLRMTEVTAGHHYRLILELAEPAIGKLEGNLRIRTDHPRHPEIIVPVAGNVTTQRLLVSPETILLPADWEGAITRHVVIRSVDKTPFSISAIDKPHKDIGVRIFAMGNAGYRLQIANIGAAFLDADSQLTITTDFPDIEPITIPINKGESHTELITTTRRTGGGEKYE